MIRTSQYIFLLFIHLNELLILRFHFEKRVLKSDKDTGITVKIKRINQSGIKLNKVG